MCSNSAFGLFLLGRSFRWLDHLGWLAHASSKHISGSKGGLLGWSHTHHAEAWLTAWHAPYLAVLIALLAEHVLLVRLLVKSAAKHWLAALREVRSSELAKGWRSEPAGVRQRTQAQYTWLGVTIQSA